MAPERRTKLRLPAHIAAAMGGVVLAASLLVLACCPPPRVAVRTRPEPPTEVDDPVAELRAGLVAHREGRTAEARRRFDRARLGFRRAGMTEALLALRLRLLADENQHFVAFEARDTLQPPRPEPRFAPVTGPYAVFERSSSEPRYFLEGDELSLLGGTVATWPGPLRLVDDGGVTVVSDDGLYPLATARGIAFVERSGAALDVVIYDPSTRKRVEQTRVATSSLPRELSTDGQHLCLGFDEDRVVFDLQPWRELPPAKDTTCSPPPKPPLPPRHESPALEIASAPDPRAESAIAGGTIAWASAAPSEPFLNVWNMRDGWRLRSKQAACRPALDAEGTTVAAARCGDSHEVTVHRLDTGEHRTHSVPFPVEGLTLSAHGSRLLVWGAQPSGAEPSGMEPWGEEPLRTEQVVLFEPFGDGRVTWSAPGVIPRRAVMAPDGSSVVVTIPGGFDLWWLPGSSATPEPPVVFSIPCAGNQLRYVDAHTVQCGAKLVDLRRPRAAPQSAGPPRPYLTIEHGWISLLDAAGRRRGAIHSDGQRGAFAVMSDGTLDTMGGDHPTLHCRYGHVLAPLVVCGDRIDEGAVRRAWTSR